MKTLIRLTTFDGGIAPAVIIHWFVLGVWQILCV